MLPDEAKKYYKDVSFMANDSKLRWLESSSGEFSSRKYLQVRRNNLPHLIWGTNIWQQWLPPRFSLLVWRIIHRGLPLDVKMRRFGIYMASQCSCCLREEETFRHLFFEGEWATRLWGFLASIFECKRPTSVETFIVDWLNSHEKKDARSSLKLGLACVGLHYIWRLRNNHRHEETTSFDKNELTKWAGFLVNFIPKGKADSLEFRKVLMVLRIPFNFRSTLEGKWSVWEPDHRGITMDVAISEDCSNTAMLIRDDRGTVLGADRMQINSIDNAKDLDRIIDHWKGHTNLAILYAHHFSYSGNHQWSRDVRVKKVHPLVLRASMSLCYNIKMTYPVDRYECLPIATRKLIEQDLAKLRIFCAKEEAMNQSDTVINRSSLSRLFIDDTSI